MENKNPVPNHSLRSAGVSAMAGGGFSLTPKEIIDILRRHLFLIISITVVGMMVGGGLWFVLRRVAPKYTARTYIEVLSPGQSDPTQIVTTLANKDIAYEFRFSKAALIKQQRMLQDLIRRDAIRETKWFAKFDNDVVKTVKNLEDNLGVSPDRNSNYISVSMTCGDAKESALIVNEMVDLFIKSQQTSAEAGIGQKLRELTEQETSLRNKLRGISDSLADIRRSTGITQLEEGSDDSSFRHTITQKLANLEIEKVKLEADLEQIRASVKNYEDRTISDEIIRRSSEQDPVVQYLIQRITTLEAELARKLTNLGENHREVQQLREVLRQTIAEKEARGNAKAQQIRDSDITSIRDQLTVMTNRMARLEQMRTETEKEQRDLDETKATYDQLVSDREEAKEKLFSTQEQISKYNLIKQDAESSKVKAVGLAPAPLEMSSPKLLVFVPGGTFLGMMLGVGLAFLLELLNDLLRSPSDVMKYLPVPLLGMIVHKDIDSKTKKADMWSVARKFPFSVMAECYRQLRTNLKLTSDSALQKVIYIASGNAEEGRTTVAVNMAYTFAAENNKVLFIDTNFRRPASDKVFSDTETCVGNLSDYLTGRCSIEQTLRSGGIEDMDVIDSGQLPSHPAELLGGGRMLELINYARLHYDRIIIDGPPMLVSDAKSLVSQADGTVLVFNTAITRRGTAKRIVRELREIDANVLGAVLVGVRVLKGGYFKEMFESYRQYQSTDATK